MIERLARGLCRAEGHQENVMFDGIPMWMSFVSAARGVLAYMREPSETMVAGAGANPEERRRLWQSMIDAELASDIVFRPDRHASLTSSDTAGLGA